MPSWISASSSAACTESYLVTKVLKEAGIPVTHLVTDYSDQDTESLRTRIEAFLKMVRVRER
ncbi:MAG: 2-hydroxyacyl-CoA dehydratase [Clostridia bacterium]|nr:2-hydroxyacyl-CoA dehydratase [Clostridia bacterium]